MDFKEKNEEQRLPVFNLYLIAISLCIIVIGLVIMFVGPDSEANFEPDIFSFRRTTVGPLIAFFGFVSVIFSILCQKRSKH